MKKKGIAGLLHGFFAALLLSAGLSGCDWLFPPTVTQVSAGGLHTMALKSDGSLWAAGYNHYGQLGDGGVADSSSFIKVAENVRQVACGLYHTVIVREDGSVWAVGLNGHGQLGDGSDVDASAWIRMKTDAAHYMTDAKAVAAGGQTSFVLKNDGSLWACGYNESGGLGDGTTAKKLFLVQVLAGVKTVYSGGDFNFAVKNDGGVWITGGNNKGQLGNGSTTDVYTFTQLPGWTNPRIVACGLNFSLILKGDGTLWATGDNSNGQFGSATPLEAHAPVQIATGVESVAAGWGSSHYIESDGSLLAAGFNLNGQLGDGTTTTRKSFVQTKVDSSAFLEKVKAVSAGVSSCIVVREDDTLWGTGWNANGQLGNGTTADSYYFKEVP